MSSSRSLYGHLIPIGNESKFFGLYEVTDKGSSWIGPLISTFIAQASSLRYAIIYILTFLVIAIPILQFTVNYDEGLKEAGKLHDFDDIINENIDTGTTHNDHNDNNDEIEIMPLNTTSDEQENQKYDII